MIAVALTGWGVGLTGVAALLVLRARLRRRAALVARAVHELRGPLGAAQLTLSAMQRRGEAPAARLAGLDLELRRAGLALDDLGRAPRGRTVAPRREPVVVADLLGEQLAVWGLVARGLGADLVLGGVPGRAQVLADRVRLAQAIGNLLANAIEHAGGRIELTAAQVGGRVRIEVRDDGPGLPAVRPAEADGPHGHGLAVAATVARAHGGRLTTAPAARGARIALELPVLGSAVRVAA